MALSEMSKTFGCVEPNSEALERVVGFLTRLKLPKKQRSKYK